MNETQDPQAISVAVIMSGGLNSLKETQSRLSKHGVGSQVLPPEDGCINR